MPISSKCLHCGAAFDAPLEFSGKKVKCPKCQKPITIPAGKVAAKKAAAKRPKAAAVKPLAAREVDLSDLDRLVAEAERPACEPPVPVPPPVNSGSASPFAPPLAPSVVVQQSPAAYGRTRIVQARIVDVKMPFASVLVLTLKFLAAGLLVNLVLAGVFFGVSAALALLGLAAASEAARQAADAANL